MKSLRKEIGLLLGLALLPALAAALWHPQGPDWSALVQEWKEPLQELSVQKVQELEEPPLFIDARSLAHFEESHIPGALCLNEELWEEQLEGFVHAWKPGTAIVVYCDQESCLSSKRVARRLKTELELEDVSVLQGGWQAWRKATP